MTCKFSRSCPTRRLAFGRATVFVLLLSLGGSAGFLRAQQPAPGKEPKAYIRFWNMLPINPANSLLVFAGDKPLFGASPFDLYTDYNSSPVGSYNLVVKRTAENSPILQKLPVVLQDKAFVTLVASEKNGQATIEILNDTPDPKVTELAAQLVVRSYYTGGTVSVGVTGGQPAQPVASGGTVTLDNLPMTAGVNLIVQVSGATPPPAARTWNLSADFSVTHHATLLLVPDHYGRMLPKLFYNGRLAHPEVAPQGGGH